MLCQHFAQIHFSEQSFDQMCIYIYIIFTFPLTLLFNLNVKTIGTFPNHFFQLTSHTEPLSECMSFLLSVSLFLSVCLSVSMHLNLCTSEYLSFSLSFSASLSPSVSFSVCLCMCVWACVSVSLPLSWSD